MRAISVSICLIAAAFVVVQADPTQDAQTFFADALQLDEPEDTVSELDYRSSILRQLEQPKFRSEGFFDFIFPPKSATTAPVPTTTNCTDTLSVITGLLPGLDSILNISGSIPILGTIVTQIKKLLDNMLRDVYGYAIAPLTGGINAIKLALEAIAEVPVVGAILKPVREMLDRILGGMLVLKGCDSSASGGESKREVAPEAQCSAIADLYRVLINDSIKQIPVIPESASEDLKRVAAGSLSVLTLMGSHSIASSNDDILKARPIFSADLLDQYRRELMLLAGKNKDLKKYAQTNLAIIVSMSNALEACLNVAADPIGAAEDLALAYEDMADEVDW
ncbi:hypothetical protein BGX28_004212 [Mortierella sp. GBA30]|nr:hypothetical protein BGX28_004212 [Mortierella sp. GBA30]